MITLVTEYFSVTEPGRRYRLYRDGGVDRLDPGTVRWVPDVDGLHLGETLVVIPQPAK